MPFLHSSHDLDTIRLTAAQLLAYTVGELFPNVLFLGGGVTKLGFYYDFIFEQPLYSEMLTLIEVQLRALVKEDLEIRPLSMMRENAASLFTHHDQPFLAEKAAEESLNIIPLMQIKEFYGLGSTVTMLSSEVGAIKLLHMEEIGAGEHEGSFIRLTGTAFPDPQSLKQFVKRYEALLKKKDHRFLGEELNLFSRAPELGEIEWFWHPKGTLLKKILINWTELQQKDIDFQLIQSPQVIKQSFFGEESLSFPFDEEDYSLSPSYLPQHLYAAKRLKGWILEYPQLFDPVEESQLWGLFSTHSYQSDLMTKVCSIKELSIELISSLQFIEQIIRIFGFEGRWVIIIPKVKQSKEALQLIKQAVQGVSFHYPLSTEIEEDEANLWGPRLELRLSDEIGREWPSSSVTVSGQGPDFTLSRSIYGSLDRFAALLIERFEGVLPMWLAPEQIRIVSVGHTEAYARTVYESCLKQGLRVKLDLRDEKLGEKIHAAEKERIPFMLIIGDQEVKKQCVTVRSIVRPGKSDTEKLEEFIVKACHACDSPSINERE